ncbi:MAG TPA: hypothetical protein VME23_17445 [Terracidiphilus sp.]|nr:hypothetical protein [Terracidiphilus sp.]
MRSSGFLFSLLAAIVLVALSIGAWSQSPQNGAVQQAAAYSPSYTTVNETLEVQGALDRFTVAVASHDVQRLVAVGIRPSSAKGWQRFFRDNPRATVTDQCSGTNLFISGDTARWSCVETATIISEGRPAQFAHLIRFTFTRTNGEWLISDRR